MIRAYGYLDITPNTPPSAFLGNPTLSDREKAQGVANYLTMRGKPIPKEISSFLESRAARYEDFVNNLHATATKQEPEPAKAAKPAQVKATAAKAAPVHKTREVVSNYIAAKRAHREGRA